LTRVFFGALAEHQEALADLNRRGAGVFVTINETSRLSRKHSDITRLRALWRDNDTGDTRPLPLEPHITVETSQGRSQDLILIDGAPLDGDLWERVQARIVTDYGSDPAAKDRCRVLRLPGFFHMKNPEVPYLVRIVHESWAQPYRWDAVLETLPPVDRNPQTTQSADVSSRKITPQLLEDVAGALKRIDPTPYHEWVRCAMWLHELGDVGFEIWIAWSRTSDKHNIKDETARKKWRETKPDSTGLGGLFKAAAENGWSNPKSRKKPAAKKSAKRRDYRRIIHYTPCDMHLALESIDQALHDAEIYQRGGMLARIVRSPDGAKKMGVERSPGSVGIIPVTKSFMAGQLCEVAVIQKFDKRSNGWVDSAPPKELTAAIIDYVGRWTVPQLHAIVETPVMRPDKTILCAPGYDPGTGLYFDPNGAGFPPIPKNPTRDDALRSLADLLHLFREFPFVDQRQDGSSPSLSVVLAAILTLFVRRSIPTSPFFAITAPSPGSGKSLIARILSILVCGRLPATVNQAIDREEERKAIFSALLFGDPVISIDNIERPVESSFLCSIATETEVRDRLLGESKMVSAPTDTVFLFNGNNLTFRGDITRRVVLSVIDPQCERPDERKFDWDILSYVREHRGELVSAALTILRAYVAAGKPKQQISAFGGFEEWSRIVRSSLVWLGEPDPCQNREKMEIDDDKRECLGRMLLAWRGVFVDDAVTAAEALSRVEDAAGLLPPELKDLSEALALTTRKRGGVTAATLGYWLRSNKGRVVDGLRFKATGSPKKALQWFVEHVQAWGG